MTPQQGKNSWQLSAKHWRDLPVPASRDFMLKMWGTIVVCSLKMENKRFEGQNEFKTLNEPWKNTIF